MRRILANNLAVVVLIRNEYWCVTAQLDIIAINEVSAEYGHAEVRKWFVKEYGEPTFERLTGGKIVLG